LQGLLQGPPARGSNRAAMARAPGHGNAMPIDSPARAASRHPASKRSKRAAPTPQGPGDGLRGRDRESGTGGPSAGAVAPWVTAPGGTGPALRASESEVWGRLRVPQTPSQGAGCDAGRDEGLCLDTSNLNKPHRGDDSDPGDPETATRPDPGIAGRASTAAHGPAGGTRQGRGASSPRAVDSEDEN
jgi:hypothetical protein